MAPTVRCPACRQPFEVPGELFGQRVQCPACKHPFVAAAPPPDMTENAPPPPAPVPADEEDDRPHRPHGTVLHPGLDRAGRILGLGLLSVFGTLVTAVLCPPLVVVPLVLGVMAWWMGRADLAAMRDGRLDPASRPTVVVGRALGMLGVALSSLVLLVLCGLVLIARVLFADQAS